jgi:GNAT superfamily N-acetyltransferase
MKQFARSVARRLLGPYALYRIYEHQGPGPGTSGSEPEPAGDDVALAPLENGAALDRPSDPGLRDLASYAGSEAFGFEARVDGVLAAACWFWVGERYKTRNFWPLHADEAKLVQITTAERFRGRRIAPRLIRFAAAWMHRLGYRRLYARIWHSNRASVVAFERAGWREIALVIEVAPLGISQPWHLVLRRRVPR